MPALPPWTPHDLDEVTGIIARASSEALGRWWPPIAARRVLGALTARGRLTPPTPRGTDTEQLRRRIDEIDHTLIDLWRERAAVSQQISTARTASGGTRIDLTRENQVLHRFRDAIGPDGTQLGLLLLRAGRGPL